MSSVSIAVSVENGLSRMMSEHGLNVSRELGKLYGFDGEEGWRRLMGEKSVEVKSSKVVKEGGKAKGRPKKAVKATEIVGETSDLFTELMSEIACSSSSSVSVSSSSSVSVPVEVSVPVPVSVSVVDKKAAAKALKDAEKVLKDAEKASVKALKDAEKAAVKATKDAEKAAAKALKDASKPKGKAKPSKSEPKEVVPEVVVEKVDESVLDEVVEKLLGEEESISVKKFTHKGVKYLRDEKTCLVYNMLQEVIGEWDEAKQEIILHECAESSDEEEEEEYDE